MKNGLFLIIVIITLCFLGTVYESVSFATSVNVSADVQGLCGNGIVNPGEQCDGSNLNGESCTSRGFSGGTLSCNATCTFNTSACTTVSPGGGGGGGGGGGISIPVVQTAVNFSGKAYPLSKITVLKDGQKAITSIAGPDANFNISLSGLSMGDYTFSVYGEDKDGLRSSLFTFSVYVTSGATTNISGIFISPTIGVNKSEVRKGDNIAIFGRSIPNGDITISVNSDEEFFSRTKADIDGVYLYNFDTSVLEMGQHSTKSKVALNGEISSFGRMVGFLVGTKNVDASVGKTAIKGDLNDDNRVNLVDFSIAAYWYKKTMSVEIAAKEIDRLNGDGKIDLADFSIMAFYWTG